MYFKDLYIKIIYLRSINSIFLCFWHFFVRGIYKLNEDKKKCGLYMRVSTEDQARGVPWKYQCSTNAQWYL